MSDIAAMLWLAVALYAIACRTSLVLLRKSYTSAAMPGCGAKGGCDAVLSSRWSRVAGMPVALPGALFYLILMVLGAAVAIGAIGSIGEVALVTLSLAAAGAAVWFAGLQLFAIGRFCAYCVTAHLCAVAACVVVLSMAQGSGQSVIIAAAGVAVLIVVQMLLSPATYTIERSEESADATAPEPRIVKFHGGKIEVNIADWPVIGEPAGAHVVAKLLDYTCEECRHLHHLLREVRPRMSEPLAIVSIPVPLDSSCNSEAPGPPDPRHANACEYARCALAVFIANPERFGEFEQWLFEKPTPPPVSATRARATQIIGAEDFELVMNAPEIVEMLKQSVTIYRQAGGGMLPKVLLPGAVLFGRVPTAAELEKLLVEQLRIRPRESAAQAGATY